MSGFTKLFSSITDSTIWCESNTIRIVWITMLAMADRDGCVAASIPGLATRARVSLSECEEALQRFLSPDKYSRTPDHEGRRIEEIHGGWRLLNYAFYRKLEDREATLARKRRWWNENKTSLDATRQTRQDSPQAEAEAEAEAEALKTKPTPKASPPAVTLPDWIPEDAWNGFTEMRKKIRAPLTPRALLLTIRQLDAHRSNGHDVAAMLDQSTQKGWRGVFPVEAPKQANGLGWWTTDQGIMDKARELKISSGGKGRQQLIDEIKGRL